MKKAVSLFMALMLMLSMNTVNLFAADTWGGYTVVASKTAANVGETVEVTVYLDDCSALSGGVYNVNFFIDLSDGLEFVSGSAELDADAFEASTGMEKLAFNEAGREGVPYTVWALGALTQGYTGGQVKIISFDCKVTAAGTQTITLTSPELTDVAGAGKLANVTPATITAHSCDFSAAWKYNTTQHWKECACGAVANLEDHSFGDWVEDKPASYTEPGEKHRDCACGYRETAPIPQLSCDGNHAYPNDWQTDADNHWKICGDCGEELKEAHDFDWVIDKPASVGDTGIKHEECSVCGYKRNEGTVIPALPEQPEQEEHQHLYGTIGMDETHHWVFCSCGDIENKNPHNFVDAGNGMLRCPDCGYEVAKTATTPATGDSSNLTLWFALMAIAAGAVSVVVYNKKRS